MKKIVMIFFGCIEILLVENLFLINLNYLNKKYETYLRGKAKKFSKYKSHLVQYFKDDATAYNNKKRKLFLTGIINNLISSDIFNYLNKNSIKTHFIKRINNRKAYKKT